VFGKIFLKYLPIQIVRIDFGQLFQKYALNSHLLGFGLVGVVGGNREKKVATRRFGRHKALVFLLDFFEGRIGSRINYFLVSLRLGSEFLVYFVVEVIQPLSRVATQMKFFCIVRRGFAAEPAGQNIFDAKQELLGVGRFERDKVEQLPPRRTPESSVHD